MHKPLLRFVVAIAIGLTLGVLAVLAFQFSSFDLNSLDWTIDWRAELGGFVVLELLLIAVGMIRVIRRPWSLVAGIMFGIAGSLAGCLLAGALLCLFRC